MSAHPICTTNFKLNTGAEFPAVGLGTWQGSQGSGDEKALEDSIVHALKSGYRHLDTAQIYGVEHVVGRAVKASGVPRSEITIVTKFWGFWHHDPAEALRISLKQLDMDYVDVFLMHWPWANTPLPDAGIVTKKQSPTFVETWKAMEKLIGPQCKAIGVSNFTQKTLDELLASATIVPAINQVELHALNPNLKLVPYCQEKGIVVTSWSTMGGADGPGKVNEIRTNEIFTSIAKAHDCSPAVVSLSWCVQRGISVIPKSATPSRIEENIRLVTLTEDEMKRMNSAHEVIGKNRFADKAQFLMVEVDGKPTLQGWTAQDFGWEDDEGNWLV